MIAIGDATGHGVPPAMVTATAKAACSVLHGLAKKPGSFAASPKIVLHLLNKAVYESTHGAILMTFFVAVMNRKTGEMTFATASHDPIYVYRKPQGAEAADAVPGNPGSKELLDVLLVEPGPRLGEKPEAYYAEGKYQLNPGISSSFIQMDCPKEKIQRSTNTASGSSCGRSQSALTTVRWPSASRSWKTSVLTSEPSRCTTT